MSVVRKSHFIYSNYLPLNLQNMTAEERTLGELTQQVAQAHQSLQGVRPDISELQYLIEAQQLDNYGLEYYPAKVRTPFNIHVMQNSRKLH